MPVADERISARMASERGLPGWPRPDEEVPHPPVPVPNGRGGPQRIPRPIHARAGDPPPWLNAAVGTRRPTVQDVRAALAAVGPPNPPAREYPTYSTATDDVRPSAVLAPLYDADGLAHVVLTRRTLLLRAHAGEVSFPGGRVEPGEALVDAATRETREEIGLDPAVVEIIGELDHLPTVSSRSVIVPFVGVLPTRPDTRPNPDEVETVLHVALAELADPAVYREEIWTFPDGGDRSIYFFELNGDTVWGATASMLRQLVGIVTGTLGRDG